MQTLLDYSRDAELDILDGKGDTPLHSLIAKKADVAVIRTLLDVNPQLLHHENAVGRTPAEVARDNFKKSVVYPLYVPDLAGET